MFPLTIGFNITFEILAHLLRWNGKQTSFAAIPGMKADPPQRGRHGQLVCNVEDGGRVMKDRDLYFVEPKGDITGDNRLMTAWPHLESPIARQSHAQKSLARTQYSKGTEKNK